MNELIQEWDAKFSELRQISPGIQEWTPILFVAGLDISFDYERDVELELPSSLRDVPDAPETAQGTLSVACLSLFDLNAYPKPALIDQILLPGEIRVPYIAGYLGFREQPFYRELLSRYRTKHPVKFDATVFMVDGNGVLHPRRFGSACFVGISTDVPVRSFGVAKSLLCIPEVGEQLTMEYIKSEAVRDKLRTKGDRILLQGRDLTVETGKEESVVYGAALLASSTSRTPIFVSEGYGLSLDECIDVVLRCSETRIPEPIKASDGASRKELGKLLELEKCGVDVRSGLYCAG